MIMPWSFENYTERKLGDRKCLSIFQRMSTYSMELGFYNQRCSNRDSIVKLACKSENIPQTGVISMKKEKERKKVTFIRYLDDETTRASHFRIQHLYNIINGSRGALHKF